MKPPPTDARTLIDRRQWMAGAAALAGSALFPAASIAAAAPGAAPDSLAARASRRGLVYGCAVESRPLLSDPDYAAAILRESGLVVAAYETKWGVSEPKRGKPDYARSDAVFDFARRHGLAVRGHTAVWHINVPEWAGAALRSPDGKDVMDDRVRGVLTHYGDRIPEWDVVNEAIETRDGQPGGLRKSVFYETLGEDYILSAFEVARQTLPAARLYYNDYGFEYPFEIDRARRRALIGIVERLHRRQLIDGIGLQSHIWANRSIDPADYRGFLTELAAFGLPILLSEFDVNDAKITADIAERDRIVAEHATRFLEVALDEKAVEGIVTWGLSDKYNWMNTKPFSRRDGKPGRGMPLDARMQRKPLWHAIAACLDQAPDRR